jgi:hypothetical protein
VVEAQALRRLDGLSTSEIEPGKSVSSWEGAFLN